MLKLQCVYSPEQPSRAAFTSASARTLAKAIFFLFLKGERAQGTWLGASQSHQLRNRPDNTTRWLFPGSIGTSRVSRGPSVCCQPLSHFRRPRIKEGRAHHRILTSKCSPCRAEPSFCFMGTPWTVNTLNKATRWHRCYFARDLT